MVIDRIDQVGGTVVIAAHPRARASRCRRCGRVSTRVHSATGGTWRICPVSGRPAEVMLTVRRFFCDHIDCGTGTFVEQVPGLTEPHARRSPGLQAALVSVGLALAGRAGSRLATRLGMAVGRSTLLRSLLDLLPPAARRIPVDRTGAGLDRLTSADAASAWLVGLDLGPAPARSSSRCRG